MPIIDYFINNSWWLLYQWPSIVILSMIIVLIATGVYSIRAIILMAIGGYSISGYWCLFYWGYYINGYWWLFY
jgi:hypothetical protein